MLKVEIDLAARNITRPVVLSDGQEGATGVRRLIAKPTPCSGRAGLECSQSSPGDEDHPDRLPVVHDPRDRGKIANALCGRGDRGLVRGVASKATAEHRG